MAIKRALVVDDSRSARLALRNLLEDRGLEVALADSGEAALDYLKKDSADVIFMDHTMPGMDGLEAVTAIKANPATATIPVMMYTTKEGEVYVGQARALGAVGVLPKSVQPHQLFEMLLQLGLVQERRDSHRSENETDEALEPTTAALESSQSEANDQVLRNADTLRRMTQTDPLAADRALEDQALGMSVQNLVSRILEDQHLTLRSDILRSHKSFAREVAREILKDQAYAEAEAETDVEEADPVVADRSTTGGQRLLLLCMVMLMGVASFLAFQFKIERDAVLEDLVALEAGRNDDEASRVGELRAQLNGAEGQVASSRRDALTALQWALGQGTSVGLYESAFGDALASRVVGLAPRLQRMNFTGTLKLTSHLGKFCLSVSETGTYQLADPNANVLDCDYVGHLLDNSAYVSERLSPLFAQLLPQFEQGDIQIELVALDARDSVQGSPYPSTDVSAAEWNLAAQRNNRVDVELIARESTDNQLTQALAR